MSTLIEAKDGQVYTGYENLQSVQYCTSPYMGVHTCIKANVTNGNLVLDTFIVFPNGGLGKSFVISANGSFIWQASSIFKLKVSISNLTYVNDGGYRFDIAFQLCIKIPLAPESCAAYSHHFDVPGRRLKAAELSDANFTQYLILQLLLGRESKL